MTVASQSFQKNSTSLFQAKSEGYIEDVLTSPLRPWQLALAYMAGGLVRGLTAALAIALLALPYAHERADPALASLTRLDPLYYLVDATRGGLTGLHEAPAALTLSVASAVAIAAFTTATALLARGSTQAVADGSPDMAAP